MLGSVCSAKTRFSKIPFLSAIAGIEKGMGLESPSSDNGLGFSLIQLVTAHLYHAKPKSIGDGIGLTR